jgi:nucleoside-diphosphate-sugar epimerase
MTPRLLVTGAGGYLGTQVVNELTLRGAEAHAFSRKPPEQERRGGVEWHAIDLLADDPSELLRGIRPTHCIHLAWEATPGRYRGAPENYHWAPATLRLARAFFDHGGRHFTLAGSCAEYALPAAVCDETSTPVTGDCPYAICKIVTAHQVAALAEERGAGFATGRIFYLYGPGEPNGKLIRSICQGLLRGQPVPLTSGADVVDYVFLADVARALVAIALSGCGGAVNIGTGEPVLVRDVAARLGELAGRPELLEFNRIPLGREPVRIVAATHRLTTEVGYRPAVDIHQGLRRCYEFWAAYETAGARLN